MSCESAKYIVVPPSFGRDDCIWLCHEPCNSCDAKARLLGMTSLNEVERVIWLASWVDFEVLLGGLDAFYYNSAGNDAIDMVGALQTIGAIGAANALAAANALFPGGQPSRSRDERFDQLQVIGNDPAGPLDSLTTEYYAQEPSVNWLVCKFVEAHPADLREHWDGSELG